MIVDIQTDQLTDCPTMSLSSKGLGRGTHFLDFPFLSRKPTNPGLAKALQGLALASHSLAWTSQDLDLAFQGLSRASQHLAWASLGLAQASGGADGWTDGISPHSTGLRPVLGPLSKKNRF